MIKLWYNRYVRLGPETFGSGHLEMYVSLMRNATANGSLWANEQQMDESVCCMQMSRKNMKKAAKKETKSYLVAKVITK